MPRVLSGEESDRAKVFIRFAIVLARQSTCLEARCGAVIINNSNNTNHAIGGGFNSPPGDVESQRRCKTDKKTYNPRVTDATCCMHAEYRAMMQAYRFNFDLLRGSTLYFIRIDEHGKPVPAGKPYCTHCSKMALDVGIKDFVLWHGPDNITAYDTEEYNNQSFAYTEEKT